MTSAGGLRVTWRAAVVIAAIAVLMAASSSPALGASCGSVTGPGGASPGFTTWATLQSALPGTCNAGDTFTVNLNGNLTAVSADSAINWYRAGTLVISGPDGATGNARPVMDATATTDAAIRSYAAFASGGSLILRNLIITGGERSGVLLFWGSGANVTLDNTTVTGNTAPAANTEAGGVTNNASGGAVTLQNGSEVSNNATGATGFPGGIYSTGAVTVTGSTVSGNTATAGAGAIEAYGAIALTNSTVSGNSGGPNSTGGIRSSTSLSATFSTISGNTRPSGGWSDVLLDAGKPLALKGSIVGGASADACSATAVNRSASYSLSTSAACLPSPLGSSAVVTTGDLALGALADNGGPTRTLLPANGSAAVGFAPGDLSTGLSADQRGVSRAGLFTAGAVQVALPLAPTGLAATPGLESADLDFTAGSDAGSAITNYEYALSTDGGTTYGAWTPMSPAATASPFTITGLTGGTTYDIKVRAVNATGAGQPSTGVQVTPAAPNSNASLTALTAEAGGSVVTLTPAFSAGISAYTASVPTGVQSMTVTPTVSDTYATVAVNGVTTTSGSASAALPLVVGVNAITVTVRASDGTTRDYVLTVTRAAPTQENSGGSNGTPAVDPSPAPLPMGRVSVGPRALVMRVTTPGPGVLVARGTATGLAGPACIGRRPVGSAGVSTVECVLTPRARAVLVRTPLRVRVAMRFAGTSAGRASAARVVVVPRRAVRPVVTG